MSSADRRTPVPDYGQPMGEKLRSFTAALDENPQSAYDLLCADEPGLRNLPDEDRPVLLQAFADLAVSMRAGSQDNGLTASFHEGRGLLPWMWTADEWTFNPSLHRLSSELVGEGPQIQPASHADDESERAREHPPWLVRALDGHAVRAWEEVVSLLPDVAADIVAELISEPAGSSPRQNPMCGRLGDVTINGGALKQWQIRVPGLRHRAKSTKSDTRKVESVQVGRGQAAVAFEVRVLYAVEATKMTVWVIDAHVFRRDLRSPKWSMV